jgi:hypothetical protein
MRAGRTGRSLSAATSPRSASRLMLGLAARMLSLALLRAAAPPARPHRTRRSHKPLDGSDRAGCMSAAQAATIRSHHDIHGVTKPVKTAARVPVPCGDEPWCRPSSLAADPSKRGHSAPTLGVSSATAARASHARGPVELATRCEREKLVLASLALVSPRSTSRSQLRHAACLPSFVLLRATSGVLCR